MGVSQKTQIKLSTLESAGTTSPSFGESEDVISVLIEMVMAKIRQL